MVAYIDAFLAQEIAKMRAEVEANVTRLLAPLVSRAGGTVTLSAAELARPWSLSTLELPDGGVTLVAVVLGEVQRCRVCGCTDDQACPGGCSWVEPDLCSRCAPESPHG